MTIARVSEMIAQKGREDELRDFIDVVVRPTVERSSGAVTCRVFRNREDPAKFLVIEEWESPEAQRGAQLATPPDQMRHLRILLAGGGAPAAFYDPLP
jgi:quinol monooxygenase YgiN